MCAGSKRERARHEMLKSDKMQSKHTNKQRARLAFRRAEGKKCRSPQKCARVTRQRARFARGRPVGGSREFGGFFRPEVGTAASAADSGQTKARCAGPDKMGGRAASECHWRGRQQQQHLEPMGGGLKMIPSERDAERLERESLLQGTQERREKAPCFLHREVKMLIGKNICHQGKH